MRCDVVEGEPGIFPDPVARVLRAIGGLFGRDRGRGGGGGESGSSPAEPEPSGPPTTEADTDDTG